MNIKKIVNNILSEKKTITKVFFVACGGSLVDLYIGKYFLDENSYGLSTGYYTSREFVYSAPKSLNKNTITIICTHSGKTPEAIEAVAFAKKRHSSVIVMTYDKNSKAIQKGTHSIIYEWGDTTSVAENPMGITLSIVNELLYQLEGSDKYNKVIEGLNLMDELVNNAENAIEPKTKAFAKKFKDEPLIYIMASGAGWSQAYGFSICSLMEMLRIHSCYIHSGEYFHGPLEATEEGVLYLVLMSEGKTRMIDERAVNFLKKYTDKLEVVDARQLGLSRIDEAVVDYFNPILFYAMACKYRAALSDIKDHPLETRRYMGKVDY